MSAANFTAALALELSYEGGLVNNPADPGGITNLGVTLPTLTAFLGKSCTADDIRCLTRATVTPLYKRDFWDVISGDLLPSGIDLIVFDGAIVQGPGTVARILQRCVGATPDGAIGPATLRAVNDVPADLLIERIRKARLSSYQQDSDWPSFGTGWSRRLTGVAYTATSWAAKASPA